jgi:hypothetical protein
MNVAKEGKEVITITWGDQAENGVGMQQIGKLRAPGSGFTVEELEEIYNEHDLADIYYLNEPDVPGHTNSGERAAVVVLRDGVDYMADMEMHDDLFSEIKSLDYDKQKLIRGRVVNSNARWNLCVDKQAQMADLEQGKGTVVSYSQVPQLMSIANQFEIVFGDKARRLKGEINYYYDIDKCGIGFHGDAERRIVIAMRLGEPLPLYYQWYRNGEAIGEVTEIPLKGGDIYIMSEKAVGTDWKTRNCATLRHATGSSKYTKLK